MTIIRSAARSLRLAILKTWVALVVGVPYRRLAGLSLRRTGGRWIAFRRGTSDEGVLDHSFEHDIFLSGVPEYQPQPGETILDVGAHLGDFALLVAGKVGSGRVYAIEPSSATFALLETNIALNRAATIQPLELALADHDGVCTLFHAPPGESWGDSTSHDYTGVREEVPCQRLATFLDGHGIERIDFAKFNCEGGEFAILMAADVATLRRIRTMLVLYHCDFAAGASEVELIAHLEAAGFATTIRNRTEDRGWIVARRPSG